MTLLRGPHCLLCVSMSQVMQCVREVRRNTVSGAEVGGAGGAGCPQRYRDDEALRVKNWLPGSYSRLKRSMESAVSHPTGRGIPVLWRMYMSLEVCLCALHTMRDGLGPQTCCALKPVATLPTGYFAYAFRSGHARESHASQASVLAGDSRLPGQ